MRYPVTPDGRYFVVRGRLWRCSNPALAEPQRDALTAALMRARPAIGRAGRAGDVATRDDARRQVHATKVALGERGPPWWTDGARDWNRHLAKNTPYAAWYRALDQDEGA